MNVCHLVAMRRLSEDENRVLISRVNHSDWQIVSTESIGPAMFCRTILRTTWTQHEYNIAHNMRKTCAKHVCKTPTQHVHKHMRTTWKQHCADLFTQTIKIRLPGIRSAKWNHKSFFHVFPKPDLSFKEKKLPKCTRRSKKRRAQLPAWLRRCLGCWIWDQPISLQN